MVEMDSGMAADTAMDSGAMGGMSHDMHVGFVTEATATHVAVSDGDWSDPTTWRDGLVPGDDADVYIGQSFAVRYDMVSDARLNNVQVDGELNFATDIDTKMVVDTIYTGMNSVFTIGESGSPVDADVRTDIIFVDGAIDSAVDPEFISRGLVTHGEVKIYGAEKAAYTSAVGEPMAGDSTIQLSGDISGWRPGDKIVVMGTHFDKASMKSILQTQDEERVIVSIDANGVATLDSPLTYDHDVPAGHDFEVYIGNMTRNVTLTSENPEGVRGHVMFHKGGAEVFHAEFDELGRTDKSLPRDTDPDNPLNPAGRYSLHLHENGVGEGADLSVLVGNSVHGSPGWGIVHHSSHAAIDYNFVYDIVGAGIVSEDGNETGQWIGNFVTSATGVEEGFVSRRQQEEGDFGHSGVAYENQSRIVIQQDNIAANSNTAWNFRASELPGDTDIPDQNQLLYDPAPLHEISQSDEPAISGFKGNTAIAVGIGVDTGHRLPMTNETDVYSVFDDLTMWRVDQGIRFFNYTVNYVIRDSLFVEGGEVIVIPQKSSGIILNGVDVHDFGYIATVYGTNHDGAFVDVTYDNMVGTTQGTLDDSIKWIDGSTLTPVDQPIVFIDESSDLVLNRDTNDRRVEIKGTITDSLGTIKFAANEWHDQPHQYRESLKALFNPTETFQGRSYDDALTDHGALRDGAGGWIMPVTFWVTDRLSGETYSYMVPLQLKGFDEAYLEQFEIEAYVPPSREIPLVDTVKLIEAARSDGETPPVDANTAPVANDDTASVDAGGSVTIDVLANDTDADGDTLIIDSATADNGFVTITTSGDLNYVAADGFSGDDQVTYVVSDGNGGTATATATISVSAPPPPANTNPVANDDTASVAAGGSVKIDVLANDSDADGDAISVVSATAVNGTVTIADDGSLTYTASATFEGTDVVTYQIKDEHGATAEAEVSMNVSVLDDLGTRSAQMWEFEEWTLSNATYAGDPFDVDASVTFTHTATGETITTGMFYDGGTDWSFRFTGTLEGEWTFETSSADADLDGHAGSISVALNDDPNKTGFLTTNDGNFAVQTTDANELEPFMFNVFMNYNYQTHVAGGVSHLPDVMADYVADAKSVGMDVVFTGVLANNLFDNGSIRYDETGSVTPDLAAFEALEAAIKTAHDMGAYVHIWLWGDRERKWVQDPNDGGINGEADLAMQEYIAARLAPLPGWTMGYGFDLQEWVTEDEVETWASNMKSEMGWDHILSARGYDTPSLSVASYSDLVHTYDDAVTNIQANPDKPHFFEERDTYNRIHSSLGAEKGDLNMENTKDMIWSYALAGGHGGFWGFERNAGAEPYSNPEQLATYGTFWDEGGRFMFDMEADNSIVQNGLGIKSNDANSGVVYIEDASSVTLDLTGFTGSNKIIAVNANLEYAEIDLGTFGPGVHTIALPSTSDWAIAIGDFDGNTVTPPPPANVDPTAVDDQASTTGTDAVTIDVLANDTDADGDTLAISSATAANGAVTITSDGKLAYVAAEGFSGADQITYVISDGKGGTATATATVSVAAPPPPPPVNTDPVANDDTGSTIGTAAVTIDVLANDTDADGDTLAISSATAANGSVTITSDGKLAYVAAEGFSGDDQITYVISDGKGGTATATATVSVAAPPPPPPVNTDPVANDDTGSTIGTAAVTIDVLANDTDADGDTLAISSATAANGAVTITSDGKLAYVAAEGFSGDDQITYVISDGNGGTATATATVSVAAPPPPPGPVATIRVEAEDMNLNGFVVQGDNVSSSDAHIAVRRAGGSAWTAFEGEDGLYDVNIGYYDENGDTSTFELRINGETVSTWKADAETGAPGFTAEGKATQLIEDVAIAKGDKVEIIGVRDGYEKARVDFVEFTAPATDPVTPPTELPATVRIEAEDMDLAGYVNSPADYSSGGSHVAVRRAEGTATTIYGGPDGLFNLNIANYDENDGVAVFEVFVNGALVDSWANDQDFSLPAADIQTLTIRVIEDIDLSTGDEIKIHGIRDAAEKARFDYLDIEAVAVDDGPPPPVNIDPVANDDTGSTIGTDAITIDVLANDTDADGDTLTIDTATAANGSVTITSDGKLAYVAAEGFSGDDQITYAISDGKGGTATGTVTVSVAAPPPVNINPVANDDTGATVGTAAVTLDVLANDTDADGDTLTIDTATAANGSVTITDGGELIYVAAEGFAGDDQITYAISDGNGGTATGTAVVSVEAPLVLLDTIRIEAEDMFLTGYVESPADYSSNGAHIAVRRGEGTAKTTYDGPDGVFNLNIANYDETDGEAVFEVYVNGTMIETWVNDKGFGAVSAGTQSLTVSVIESVELTSGDEIQIRGVRDSGEKARIDYLDIEHVGAILSATAASSEPAPDPVLQVGRTAIDQTTGSYWQTISFDQTIENAIVTATSLSYEGGHQATVRVRNVTDEGFQFQIDEWDFQDGRHKAELVSWVAVSEGVHTLADGRTVSAGEISLLDETPATVSLDAFDATPTVFSQVMSFNDDAAVSSRLSNVSATGFELRMQEEEAADGIHGSETVSWIAIEAGGGVNGLMTGSTGETVTEEAFNFTYDDTFSGDVGLLVQMQTMNDEDTAAVRILEQTGSGATIFVEEETSLDAEIVHGPESVAWLAAELGVYDLS